MHNFMFFDTETTSLIPAKDGKPGGEVIQFAGIEVDKNFEIKRVINRYCDTAQLMSQGAEAVHKLSNKKVEILSEGKFFESIVEEERLRDFDNLTWIAYNAQFDIRMINQTLTQNGYAPIDFGATTPSLSFNANGVYRYDVMDPLGRVCGFTRRVKLEKLISIHIGMEFFKNFCGRFREQYGIIDPLTGDDYLHNAIFDVAGMMLLVHKFRNILLR